MQILQGHTGHVLRYAVEMAVDLPDANYFGNRQIGPCKLPVDESILLEALDRTIDAYHVSLRSTSKAIGLRFFTSGDSVQITNVFHAAAFEYCQDRCRREGRPTREVYQP